MMQLTKVPKVSKSFDDASNAPSDSALLSDEDLTKHIIWRHGPSVSLEQHPDLV